MDAVVLDTDVLSFIAKRDNRAAQYLPALTNQQLCICFQTVAELQLWALIRRWGQPRRQSLNLLLERFVVLPYDAMMAEQWANITAHRRDLGKPIDCGDASIADSAMRHNALLLSHNVKHYTDIPGLRLFSSTG
jgi:predicted nucleic acid-binding protein